MDKKTSVILSSRFNTGGMESRLDGISGKIFLPDWLATAGYREIESTSHSSKDKDEASK